MLHILPNIALEEELLHVGNKEKNNLAKVRTETQAGKEISQMKENIVEHVRMRGTADLLFTHDVIMIKSGSKQKIYQQLEEGELREGLKTLCRGRGQCTGHMERHTVLIFAVQLVASCSSLDRTLSHALTQTQ